MKKHFILGVMTGLFISAIAFGIFLFAVDRNTNPLFSIESINSVPNNGGYELKRAGDTLVVSPLNPSK